MNDLKEFIAQLPFDALARLFKALKFSFHDWLTMFLANRDLPPVKWKEWKERHELDRAAVIRLGWALKNKKVRLERGTDSPKPEAMPPEWNALCCAELPVPCKIYHIAWLQFGIGECEKCRTIIIVTHNEKTHKEFRDRLSIAASVYEDFRRQRLLSVREIIGKLFELWGWALYLPQEMKAVLFGENESPLLLVLLNRLMRWKDKEVSELEAGKLTTVT